MYTSAKWWNCCLYKLFAVVCCPVLIISFVSNWVFFRWNTSIIPCQILHYSPLDSSLCISSVIKSHCRTGFRTGIVKSGLPNLPPALRDLALIVKLSWQMQASLYYFSNNSIYICREVGIYLITAPVLIPFIWQPEIIVWYFLASKTVLMYFVEIAAEP